MSSSAHDQHPARNVKTRVPGRPTLVLVAFFAMPAIASAQTLVAPVIPPEPSAPLRLFKDAAPESSGGWIGSIKTPNWWEPPASGSEVPRWAIGHTVAFNSAGRLPISAGLFGRRGDPLPLYLSQGTTRGAGRQLTGPGSYRLQWDAKFGVSAPVWTGPRLKIHAIGELFVPLTRSSDPADASGTLLSSRTLRFGIMTVF